MRIVLIITDYGSFNNFLSELAIRLREDGHEVSVITSETKVINIQDKFDYSSAGIKFFYVDFPRGFNPLAHYLSSKKIQKILDGLMPDIVHIHFTTGIFTTLFAGRLKYRTFGTFHGLGFPVLTGLKRGIFGVVERFCFNRLDKIFVLNEVDFKAVKALGYNNVEKYETVGLGCDLSVFNPQEFSENQKTTLREKLGIRVDNFVFTYTGRFVNFKGYDKVIRSFLKLYSENPNIKLLLIGGNDPIHPTGLTDNEVSLMNNCRGIIQVGFTKDVAFYLSITNAFVFPSVKEGMPVCVIEALAMNVPVITADSRGCNEIIQNEYNGYVVDVSNDNWSHVFERMEQLSINKEHLDRFKSNIHRNRSSYDRNRYVICEKNRYEQYSSIEK